LNRRLDGPQRWSRNFGEDKNLWPCLEPQVVQSVAYTDYTVLAPVVITVANLIVSQPIVSGSFRKGAVTY